MGLANVVRNKTHAFLNTIWFDVNKQTAQPKKSFPTHSRTRYVNSFIWFSANGNATLDQAAKRKYDVRQVGKQPNAEMYLTIATSVVTRKNRPFYMLLNKNSYTVLTLRCGSHTLNVFLR